MKTLKIKWQRLVSDGATCPRCGATEEEMDRAVFLLRQSLSPLGIDVVLEKSELSPAEFKERPLASNQIWLNGRSLERWLDGEVGQSPCCDVCGPNDCRTLQMAGQVYETVPADLIVRAGLLAAAQMPGATSGQCGCGGNAPAAAKGKCCPT